MPKHGPPPLASLWRPVQKTPFLVFLSSRTPIYGGSSRPRPVAFGNLENLFIQHTLSNTHTPEMGGKKKFINKFFVLYFGCCCSSSVAALAAPPPVERPLFGCSLCFLLLACLCFVAGFVIYSKSVPFWLYIERLYTKTQASHIYIFILAGYVP